MSTGKTGKDLARCFPNILPELDNRKLLAKYLKKLMQASHTPIKNNWCLY